MTVQDYVDKDSYLDSFKLVENYTFKSCKVYNAWCERDKNACVGYPIFLLEKDGKVRPTDLKETIRILSEVFSSDEE